MIVINTHEAKTKLSWLLSKVENDNEEIKICRNGKPIALMVPLGKFHDPLKQHPNLMGVKLHEDPTAPLTDDEWPYEPKYGKKELPLKPGELFLEALKHHLIDLTFEGTDLWGIAPAEL